MAREVVKRTLPKSVPKDMEEMYSSPRKHDADVVRSILRANKIKYRSTDENRGIYGRRYYVYTPKKQSDFIFKLLEEELSARDM